MKIVFTACNGWVSRAIRFVTRSKVSHVAFTYYDVSFGREMILEATSQGFHIGVLDKFVKGNTIVESFDIDAEDLALLILADWLGSPYDFGGLIGEAIVQLARIFKRRIRNPFASRKAFFCSEIAVYLLKAMKYPGSEILIPENTDPQSLLRFLKDSNGR